MLSLSPITFNFFPGFQMSPKLQFICPNCNKVYTQKRLLVRHLNYECGQLPKFGCSKCQYRAHYKYRIERHLATIHHLQNKLESQKCIYYNL